MYKYGDTVKIKKGGAVGEICDIKETATGKSYVIDQHNFLNADQVNKWDEHLISAKETEIEHI
ncbi:MAG: hypothetical protein RR011_05380 [Oscillospiraceae bacterium]